MTRDPDEEQQGDTPQPEHVLAKIPEAAPHDDAGSIEVVENPTPAQPQPQSEGLALPRGALVAIRKSGGFRFTSRTVTVYRNGRVTVEDRATSARPAGRFDDTQLAELYRALDGANLPDLPPSSGRQNPDAYVYEIVARLGRTVYSVETFDGSIPPQLVPLIQLLGGYMNSEDQGQSANPGA